jgi:predicted RNase H-like HicB family nuclease
MDWKYEMIIYWSNEDHAYIVEVPELPGCMADGRTYQEAVSNAEVVIAEWVEAAEELGRPIPNPRGKLMYAWRYAQQLQGKGTMETKKFIYYQEEDMFVGWLEEYSDYRTQGETMQELGENLVDIYKDLANGHIPCVHKVGELKVA